MAFNNVVFSANVGGPITDLSRGSLRVNGTLSLATTEYRGCPNINNGALLAYGDVNITGSCGGQGSSLLVMKGNAAGQTITGSGSAAINSLEIAAGGNAVTLAGTVKLNGNYTLTSVGTFVVTGSTLNFGGGGRITPGTVAYNNVTFSPSSGWSVVDLGTGSMKINGLLTLAALEYYGCPSINNGTLQAYGDVTVSGSCGGPGSYALQFLGAHSPTVTVASGSLSSTNITVNLSAGYNLRLGSALTCNAGGQALNVISGGVNLLGYALALNSLTLNGNVINEGGGSLTVTSGASPWGGVINP